MKVASRRDAWKIANMIFPTDYQRDNGASERAGYPIYYTTAVDMNAWISDLGSRLELNMPDGNSLNIWIDSQTQTEAYVHRDEVLGYVQKKLDEYKETEDRYGIGSKMFSEKLCELTACKMMAETLLHRPVTLRSDGKVVIT